VSNLALYRKYRSRDFSELIGQEHITQSLETAVKEGRISHAYLFSGPRGVGKTSAARILARRINNLPANLSQDHLDIIEIDGASNRRIDEVRDLREKVHIAPSQGKYKVYVIDEVHMLTSEAFNALLKTLEEPPSHVVFILATTEPHKLPETIISRTQHFNFRPIQTENITSHLASIAKLENIKINEEALSIIAACGNGSFRDAIGMLDQLPRAHNIDANYVRDMLGMPKQELVYELVLTLINKDPNATLSVFDTLMQNGVTSEYLHIRLLEALQSLIRSQLGNASKADHTIERLHNLATPQELNKIATTLAAIPSSSVAFGQLLEAILIDLALGTKALPAKTTVKNTINAPSKVERAVQDPDITKVSQKKPAKATALNEDAWLRVLSHIKQKNPSLFGLLKTAETTFDDNSLKLGFRFQFHLKKLEESTNRNLLQTTLKTITGTPISCELVLLNSANDIAKSDSNNKSKEPDTEINAVLQILGGEIVNGK
jgi:DNA polymerase-3 subunit gamma/tau